MLAVYGGSRVEVLLLDQILAAFADQATPAAASETTFAWVAENLSHAYAVIEEKSVGTWPSFPLALQQPCP